MVATASQIAVLGKDLSGRSALSGNARVPRHRGLRQHAFPVSRVNGADERRHVWMDDQRVPNVDFRLAQHTHDFDQAFRLVHDLYVSRGYMAPHPSGRRLSRFNTLPTTTVVIAQAHGDVVGTVTLIEDSPLGLPTEEIYHEELAVLRVRQRRIGEVSALALASDQRARGVAILMRMLRLILVYAVEYAQLDDLFLAVNPRHAEFYRKFFKCRPFGPLRFYDKVNGAPAVALRLDLADVRALTAAARHGAALAVVDEFLYGATQWRRLRQQIALDAELSALTPAEIAYFFADQEVPAAPRKQAFIQSSYPARGDSVLAPAFAAT